MAKNKEEELDGMDGIVYSAPPPFEEIYNQNKPKKEQKWERPKDPNFLLMTAEEKQTYQLQELNRIDKGFHFYNNGELTYICGSHYGFLKHWDLGGGKYPNYRKAHRNIALAQDLIKKDNNCYGLVAYTMKRYGKSEFVPARMLMDSLLTPKGNYFLQATKDDKAKTLFQRTLNAFLALGKSLPYIYQHTYTNESIFFKQTQTIKRSSEKVQFKDGNYTRIEAIPSKITSIQGEKITEYFLDEFASQELMDMEQLFQTLIAQCTEGTRDIIGKIWMISTVENAKSKSVPFSENLWHTSDPNKKDANGRTESGLYRMLIPYYLSDPSFIDEYGNPKSEESKTFFYNMLASATDGRKQILKRQFPEVIDDIFDLNKQGGLELDVIEILKHRQKELVGKPQPLYDVSYYKNELVLSPTEKEGQFTVEMFEPVYEHHTYRVGVDATSTAKNSTNKNTDGSEKGDKKSKFALVVERLTGDNNYVDVCNYYVRPEKRYLTEKVALWICQYYNKYGKCRAYPERNASAGSTLTDLFEAEGLQRILIRELKRHNTDKEEEKSSNAYGIYIEGFNKDYRTSILNKFLRFHGHKINSRRLIADLLIYGTANSDLADALGVGAMAFGNFDIDKKPKVKIEAPKQLTRTFVLENGQVLEKWI
jgi:hypothetical protein